MHAKPWKLLLEMFTTSLRFDFFEIINLIIKSTEVLIIQQRRFIPYLTVEKIYRSSCGKESIRVSVKKPLIIRACWLILGWNR